MDMRLILPEKQIEIKEELKIPVNTKRCYGRYTSPHTERKLQTVAQLPIFGAMLIEEELPSWKNLFKRIREKRIPRFEGIYERRFRTICIKETKQLIIVRIK